MRAMDLAPTFLELAGATPDTSMMGRSLLARLEGGAPAYGPDELIAYEIYGRRFARRGDWKVLLQEPPFGTGDWQLYNLSNDLGEQEDVSAEHPALRQELIDAWQVFADEVGVVLPEHPIRY